MDSNQPGDSGDILLRVPESIAYDVGGIADVHRIERLHRHHSFVHESYPTWSPSTVAYEVVVYMPRMVGYQDHIIPLQPIPVASGRNKLPVLQQASACIHQLCE